MHYNKSIKNVVLHFVEGRLKINSTLTNYNRTAVENEQDPIEFFKSVEPIVNAKLTFEE